jgi:ferrous iron transport protein A
MTGSSLTLDDATPLAPMVVTGVQQSDAAPEWFRWLTDIGFVPGEPVMLLRRGLLGGDPLVVRIGVSTFALRRAEASCVRVAAA